MSASTRFRGNWRSRKVRVVDCAAIATLPLVLAKARTQGADNLHPIGLWIAACAAMSGYLMALRRGRAPIADRRRRSLAHFAFGPVELFPQPFVLCPQGTGLRAR